MGMGVPGQPEALAVLTPRRGQQVRRHRLKCLGSEMGTEGPWQKEPWSLEMIR